MDRSTVARHLADLLWRWSARLLGEDLDAEVLGDLLEERTPRGNGPSLGTAFGALVLALQIRLRLRPHRREQRRSRLHSAAAVCTHELRHAWWRLRRAPLFATLTLGTLVVGVAAALAVFAVVHGVLLEPLRFEEPEALVAVFTTERDGAEQRNPSSAADFLDWQRAADDLAELAAAEYWNPALGEGPAGRSSGHRQKIVGLRVTDNLLEMLGVPPEGGRVLTADDPESAVVLSSRTWQQRLGGREDVVGSTISLNGVPHTVVGVMPESFAFPPFWATDAELWVPLRFGPDPDRGGRGVRVFGRLGQGVELGSLHTRLGDEQAMLVDRFPETNRGTGVRVEPLREPVVRGSRDALRLLAAGALLLIGLMTANLAGLLISRSLERRRDLATQLVLGASRGRVALGVAFESVILMSVAALVGTGGAVLLLRLLRAMGQGAVPRLQEIHLSWASGMLAVAALGALGLFAGLLPGLKIALDGDRGLRQAGGRFGRAEGWRRTIVAAEVAITTTLLLLAGWLVRSFDRLAREDLGFETARVVGVTVDLAEDAKSQQLEQLVEEMQRHPGAAIVGAVNHLPLAGDLWRGRVFAVGTSHPDDDVRAALRVATPGYFDAMSMRLLRGRLFDETDRDDSQPVVLVNRTLADVLWPGRSPVGSLLARDSLESDAEPLLVVGVVENVKQASVEEAPPPEIYQPFSQDPFPWFPAVTLVVQAEVGHDLTPMELSRALGDVLPGVALGPPMALRDVVRHDLYDERARTFVLVLFAALSVLLAVVGLFGVVAFAAHQRQRELSLRLALGSWPGAVAWLLVREGVVLAAVGAVLGGGLALSLAPRLGAVLFETSSLDALVWLTVAGVVIALTCAASLPTAVRASRRSPARVLDRL